MNGLLTRKLKSSERSDEEIETEAMSEKGSPTGRKAPRFKPQEKNDGDVA